MEWKISFTVSMAEASIVLAPPCPYTVPVIRVGTSGWNYPSGRGTWNGAFYPPREGRPRGFDELRFYARFFDTVEVNSTFYGQPRPEVTRKWAERTPAGFEFTVKLYQKFTHPTMFREAAAKQSPEADAAWLDQLAVLHQADVDEFRRGVAPLAEAGKLGALLVQFPPSFKATPAAVDYLAWLLRTFVEHPAAVELRHRSWSDASAETAALLDAYGAAWVQIDEPKFRFSIRQDLAPTGEGLYYVRLHGRNAAQWWDHAASEDRYNYHYNAGELAPFAEAAAAARGRVKKGYLMFNNHFAAQAVANAVQLRQQLGDPVSEPLPPDLVARFPELAPTP
jgi:uncharacterized protein YecE (DUF72 family)